MAKVGEEHRLAEVLAETLAKQVDGDDLQDGYNQLVGGVRGTDDGILLYMFTPAGEQPVAALVSFMSTVAVEYAPGEANDTIRRAVIRWLSQETLKLVKRVYDELA